jgi:hypothetical protein
MARILVGIPSAHPDSRFLESLPGFLHEVSKSHEVQEFWVKNRPIAEAYETIVATLKASDAEYLLILEDDHWGFTPQMLEDMLALKTPVTSIPYYSRHYPYQRTAFIESGVTVWGVRVGQPRLIEAPYKSGSHEVDIVGLGMTLFESWIFHKLESPHFEGMPLAAKEVQQKLLFRLKSLYSIRPVVLFDHIIAHGDLTPDTIAEHRSKALASGEALRRRVISLRQGRELRKVIRREAERALEVITT